MNRNAVGTNGFPGRLPLLSSQIFLEEHATVIQAGLRRRNSTRQGQSLSQGKGKSLNGHPTARAALWAINAHAGKQLVDWPELDRLSDPATSQDELESLLRKLRTFQLAE